MTKFWPREGRMFLTPLHLPLLSASWKGIVEEPYVEWSENICAYYGWSMDGIIWTTYLYYHWMIFLCFRLISYYSHHEFINKPREEDHSFGNTSETDWKKLLWFPVFASSFCIMHHFLPKAWLDIQWSQIIEFQYWQDPAGIWPDIMNFAKTRMLLISHRNDNSNLIKITASWLNICCSFKAHPLRAVVLCVWLYFKANIFISGVCEC